MTRALCVVALAAFGCLPGQADKADLIVTAPSANMVVIADRTYSVEWTGTGSNNRFEIDLFYCGSTCLEDECGEWVTALCPYGEDGCPDNEGDYDIVMPEPMRGTSGSGYKVRVMDVGEPEGADCSEEFYLMASSEAPAVGTAGGPYLVVSSPAAGDSALPGEVYTIEFDYDNGVGSRVDRFKIDLYAVDGGGGDCGTWVADLCDKELIGCKDSMGDYDVTIPVSTPEGDYSIRVGRFEDDALFGCSETFEIVSFSSWWGEGSGSGSASASSASGYGSGSGDGGGSASGHGGGSASGYGYGYGYGSREGGGGASGYGYGGASGGGYGDSSSGEGGEVDGGTDGGSGAGEGGDEVRGGDGSSDDGEDDSSDFSLSYSYF